MNELNFPGHLYASWAPSSAQQTMSLVFVLRHKECLSKHRSDTSGVHLCVHYIGYIQRRTNHNNAVSRTGQSLVSVLVEISNRRWRARLLAVCITHYFSSPSSVWRYIYYPLWTALDSICYDLIHCICICTDWIRTKSMYKLFWHFNICIYFN